MLCHLTEEGRESSYCYWPTKEGETVSYGKLMVTLQSVVSYDVFEMRKFNVKEEKACLIVFIAGTVQWEYAIMYIVNVVKGVEVAPCQPWKALLSHGGAINTHRYACTGH